MLLGVKRSTHCLLRETGQLPIYFYWLRCVARFWNSILTSNNALLSKINEADLRLAHRKGSWTSYDMKSYLLFTKYEGLMCTLPLS